VGRVRTAIDRLHTLDESVRRDPGTRSRGDIPIDNTTRTKLEQLFDMSSGYVLDFSNASFGAFVETCLGFNPYDRYNGSKAVILRQIWLNEPAEAVAKLNLDLLEHWHLGKLATNQELTAFEARTYADLGATFRRSGGISTPTRLDFLERDFGDIDLTALPTELTARKVVEARLAEIERCLDADAPLAVVFLVGSTLEGLLLEVALAHPATFTSSPAAPVVRGQIKQLDTWTLAELITVSRALGVVGADLAKHAEHVRDFRNYIHPRQQLRENFEPRVVTAEIARQVLFAALADLQNLGDLGS
jgi:hypothetical protein